MKRRMSALLKWMNAEWGRGTQLAKAFRVTNGTIGYWAHHRVPAERLYEVSKYTDIPIWELRPDLVKKKDVA